MLTALAKYRLFKYLTFEEKEASTTSYLDEIGRGRSSLPGDQTGSIAVFNADEQDRRKKYCERIERAVKQLPKMERFLMEERYMEQDGDYLTDYNVYCFKFQPAISERTYVKIRWKAFYKLDLNLNIAVLKVGGRKSE